MNRPTDAGPGRRGDPAGPGPEWERHRRVVAAVLCAHAPAGAELEDLLQEVALIYVARSDSIRSPAALRAWLRAVAINVARGSARSAGTRRLAEEGFQADRRERPHPAGERGRVAEEERSRLEDALVHLRRLPPELLEPLLLKAVDGLSQREIAEVLGVAETTVETRLARARRLLRESMSPAGDDGVRP